jgi:hypothetical protein
VKPDEYFRMMYPYIGQAKQPAEYLDDLLCNFVVDDADFTGSPLTDKTPDYKNRIYNGSKPFPISLAAQLLDSSDPMCFSAYINDNLSDDLAENLEFDRNCKANKKKRHPRQCCFTWKAETNRSANSNCVCKGRKDFN